MLFKNKYRIESSRLKGYDYSSPGKYFITIVTKFRTRFFGHVENGKMILNETGKIANNFWLQIPDHFNHVNLDEHIVMPDHIHGIIELTPNVVETPNCVQTTNYKESSNLGVSTAEKKRHPIGIIINQFKRICTIEIRKYNAEFAWQPRFHDKIIRNEQSLKNIRQYIINNPKNWKQNKFK
ncbi:MAG: transposase [Ignavibacteria bacterium]